MKKLLSIFLFLLLALGVSAETITIGGGSRTIATGGGSQTLFFGWANKFAITIPSDSISTELTDFPLPIKISASCGTGNFDATALFDELSDANRKKILFTDASGQALYTEIESYSQSNEEAYFHVKVPTVSSSTNTVIYLWYDSTQSNNTTYVGDTGDTVAESVWDEYFQFVHHHAGDPTTVSNMKDSSSNSNDANWTNLDAADEQPTAAGFGPAHNFDEEWIQFSNQSSSLSITGALTLESYCISHDLTTADGNGILSKYLGYGENNRSYAISMTATGYAEFVISSDGTSGNINSLIDDVRLNTTAWRYIAGIYVPSTSIELRVDDQQEGYSTSSILSAIYDGTAEPVVGNYYRRVGSYSWDGLITESRISTTNRSAAWCNATYLGLSDGLVSIQ